MAAETLRGKGFDGVETSVGGVPNYTMYNPGTVYSATTGDLLYSNAKQGAAVPLALDAAERQPQGIRAYHGSPHDFDRFSLDAIGTGEGAQAYGHGLYFADSEDVARSYRDALSKQQFDPKVTQDTPELRQAAQEWLQKQGYEPAPEQIEQTVQQITQGGFAPSDFDWSKVGAEGPKGRMYEVNIRANPEDFLDWDKPLSQQSDGVKQKLGVPSPDRIAEAERLAAEIDKLNRVIDGQGGIGSPHPDVAMRMKRDLLDQYDAIDPNGSAWWKMDTKDAAARPDSAAELRKLGIPGIRYLDGMSRGAGEGSSNYVVFDDALIDILRKYANAPTGAIVPAGMEASQDDNPALIEYLKAVGLY
jgi:hypothetical protein